MADPALLLGDFAPAGTGPAPVVPAATSYCSLYDVSTMFPLWTNGPVEAQQLAIILATAHVENYTQRILLFNTYIHEEGPLIVNRNNQMIGKVRQWPIQSIIAVSILPMGAQNVLSQEQSLDISYIDFNSPPERLFYYSGPPPIGSSAGLSVRGGIRKSLRGRIYVSYTAGFPVIPQDIRLATILLAQYYLMRQANALGAVSISVTAPSSSNSISWGRRSTLLDDAEQLLNAYVRRE